MFLFINEEKKITKNASTWNSQPDCRHDFDSDEFEFKLKILSEKSCENHFFTVLFLFIFWSERFFTFFVIERNKSDAKFMVGHCIYSMYISICIYVSVRFSVPFNPKRQMKFDFKKWPWSTGKKIFAKLGWNLPK